MRETLSQYEKPRAGSPFFQDREVLDLRIQAVRSGRFRITGHKQSGLGDRKDQVRKIEPLQGAGGALASK